MELPTPELAAVVAHALLQPATGRKGGVYTFRFDFLADYLPSRWAAAEIERQAAKPTGDFTRLLARNASGSSQFVDYFARELNSDEKLDALAKLFAQITGMHASSDIEDARSCVFHVASRCIERRVGSGPRQEQTSQ